MKGHPVLIHLTKNTMIRKEKYFILTDIFPMATDC